MPEKPSIEELARQTAERAIDNGECAAQLEIAETAQLRESLVRNVAAALQAQHKQAIEEAKERACAAVCGLHASVADTSIGHSGLCRSIRRALDSAR